MSIDLDVRDLLRSPGTSRTVRIDEVVGGLRTELASVPEDRPVAADLLVESLVEGVLVSGRVSGPIVLSCARCLRSIESEFDLDLQELFVSGPGGEDDEYPLVEGFADLEPMIRDQVLLSAPFSPLCREDCQGLCERCGGDLNNGECSCSGPPPDPRWAALGKLDVLLEPGPASRHAD